MRSHDFRVDVASAAGLRAAAHVAATLHLPDVLQEGAELPLLFCLHGGGYRRIYWDLPFGSQGDYSFARYFTGRNKAVLAIDLLGMGESSQPDPESELSRLQIAAASARALQYAVGALRDGTWARASQVSVTGVGHSIGGMMIITQAAGHEGLDRVAVLGWANQPMVLGDTDPATLRADLIPSGYLPSPRQALRKLFYLPDVAASLIEADEALGTRTPSCLGRDALTPGIVHGAAAQIRVPVMVVHGMVDTSPDPHGEMAYFKGSTQLALNVLEGSAHCHNLATTRRLHWQRLDRWIDSLS